MPHSLFSACMRICRKVTVQHVKPGGVPPTEEECDFWYDQEHDRRFLTFTDSLTEPPASKEHYKEYAGPRVRGFPLLMQATAGVGPSAMP